MKVTVNKVDDANIIVSGTIENSVVDAHINTMAVQAGKEMKVDGFRKGKVPPHVVKQLHGDKLAQDAEGEALKDLIDAGVKEGAELLLDGRGIEIPGHPNGFFIGPKSRANGCRSISGSKLGLMNGGIILSMSPSLATRSRVAASIATISLLPSTPMSFTTCG